MTDPAAPPESSTAESEPGGTEGEPNSAEPEPSAEEPPAPPRVAQPPQPLFTVGGAVSSPSYCVVAALLNASNGSVAVVDAENRFVFPAQASGEAYSIEVPWQPEDCYCAVSGGEGTIAVSNVADVDVTCTSYVQ